MHTQDHQIAHQYSVVPEAFTSTDQQLEEGTALGTSATSLKLEIRTRTRTRSRPRI